MRLPTLHGAALVGLFLLLAGVASQAHAAKSLKVTPKNTARKANSITITIGKPGGGTDTITVPIARGDSPATKANKIVAAVESYGETMPGAKNGDYNAGRTKNKAGNPTNSVKITRADGRSIPNGNARFEDKTCEKLRAEINAKDHGNWRADAELHGAATGLDPNGQGPTFASVEIGIGQHVLGDATTTLYAGRSLADVYLTLGAELKSELAGSCIQVTYDATGIHATGLPSSIVDRGDDEASGWIQVDSDDDGIWHTIDSHEMSWRDDFGLYAAGSQLVGQGGWEEWSAGNGALVSNAQARSGSNSVDINGATDLVHSYAGYTCGTWEYSAWQFIPSSMSGDPYFILLNTYAPGGPYSWSVQMIFNSGDGLIHGDLGSNADVTMPFITDRWVEIRVVVDLDEDWTQVFYNDRLLDDPGLPDHPALGGGYRWTGGVFGSSNGSRNIAAVDLYANGSTPVYYDDMSMQGFHNSLKCNTQSLSAASGAPVQFSLSATVANAHRFYILLATLSGTSPGFPLPGGNTLPINFDFMTSVTLTYANSPLFQHFGGTLNTQGDGVAIMQIPPTPVLSGSTMEFAYTLLDLPSFDFVSRTARVRIVP